MISVITGDITNSSGMMHQEDWIKPLKKLLNTYGKSPKVWEIYRGDSFQLEVERPEESLLAAISIKACIKSVKGLDVRMAIGIGEKTYNATKITESNGTAFVNSGQTFESLKKLKRNIVIKTPWEEVDEEMNFMLQLASSTMDKWSVSSAELILLSIQHANLSQEDLGKKLGIRQSSISERQTRANYSIVAELIKFFNKKIKQQLT